MQDLLEIGSFVVLLVVLVLAVLILITVFFHVRFMVPFVPTPMPITKTMIDLADLKPGQTVYDLGAGDGRFLILAKRKQPGIRAIGYEGALGVWMLGKIRILFSGVRGIDFRCGNFLNVDLRDADTIFVYLSMNVMKLLVPKFEKELKPGTKVISHAFRLPGRTPAKTADVPMRFGGTAQSYCYVF